MKVLFDTNIILDFALERQPWFTDSEHIIYFAEQQQNRSILKKTKTSHSNSDI